MRILHIIFFGFGNPVATGFYPYSGNRCHGEGIVMNKSAIILLVVIACFCAGCTSKTSSTIAPVFTPLAETPISPAQSATPTLTPGRFAGATAEPSGDGYSIEFTNQISGGLTTIHAAAHTCAGIRGPWEGSFDLVMAAGKMTIQGSGPFNFSMQSEKMSVSGEAPFSGAGTVSGANCVILDVSDPLQFEITIHPENLTADVMMGSVGSGSITSQCGKSPPATVPFAISWGPEPLTVPILPFANCP